MKRCIEILFLCFLLCILPMPAVVTASQISPEEETQQQTETEQDTEQQTETEQETETESAGQGGTYNSKQTFGIEGEFDDLPGTSKYLGSTYRTNYYLDLEKTGITDAVDAAANGLANCIFSAFQMIAMVVGSVVYFCLDFSLADAVAGFIAELQTGLITGIFQEIWIFSFFVLGAGIAVKMFKHALMEILKDLTMVVFVTVLSILLMSHTNEVLTMSTNLTKSISNSVFSGLDTVTGGTTEGQSYAATAAGALWSDMIHEPWLTLEFGSISPEEEVVEELLSLQPGSSDRADIVKDMTKETGCFEKSRGWGRIGLLFTYFIPFIMKAAVFIVVALLQFLGQFLAVFVILLAAFVLTLAIIPSYGLELLRKWMQMFVDVHLSMVILSFLMAMMIWLNKILYSFAGTFGWFLSLLFQAAICVILALNFKTIMFMLLHPRNGMNEANRMMRQMMRRNGFGRGGFHLSGLVGGVKGLLYDGTNTPNVSPNRADDNSKENIYDTQQNTTGRSNQDYNAQRYEPESWQQHVPYVDDSDMKQAGRTIQKQSGIRQQEAPKSTVDYQAINNAPSQQELYELFHDPSEEKESSSVAARENGSCGMESLEQEHTQANENKYVEREEAEEPRNTQRELVKLHLDKEPVNISQDNTESMDKSKEKPEESNQEDLVSSETVESGGFIDYIEESENSVAGEIVQKLPPILEDVPEQKHVEHPESEQQAVEKELSKIKDTINTEGHTERSEGMHIPKDSRPEGNEDIHQMEHLRVSEKGGLPEGKKQAEGKKTASKYEKEDMRTLETNIEHPIATQNFAMPNSAHTDIDNKNELMHMESEDKKTDEEDHTEPEWNETDQ